MSSNILKILENKFIIGYISSHSKRHYCCDMVLEDASLTLPVRPNNKQKIEEFMRAFTQCWFVKYAFDNKVSNSKTNVIHILIVCLFYFPFKEYHVICYNYTIMCKEEE